MDLFKVIRRGETELSSSEFCDLSEGDTVFQNGNPIILDSDAHYSGDSDYDGYLFYSNGQGFFPEDIDTV